MLLFCVLLGVLNLINPIAGVIYELNDADYNRMPPIYHLDDYEHCLDNENAVYCTIRYNAVSDKPSELLTMMEEYSKQIKTHFSYTSSLTYGICVSKLCNNYDINKNWVPKQNLEACLNKTIWNKYKLKTQIKDFSCNTLKGNKIPIDNTDIIVAAIVACLLIMSIVGSLHDVSTTGKGDGNKYLLSFSIKRNWKKLVAPYEGRGQLSSLRGLNGIKSIALLIVILVHTFWPFTSMVNNTREVEKVYYSAWYHTIFNATLMMQMYFLLSSFLLMYTTLLSAQKKITFSWIRKKLLMRLLRLTPSYALTLGIMATWFRRAGTGPMWETLSIKPANDCRESWWKHMLFINNIGYHTECLGHTWYLAADTQLYILALAVSALNSAGNKVNLVLLYIIGAIIPAVISYARDLDPWVNLTPREIPEFMKNCPTYNEVYIPGYANIPAVVLGLALGDLVYRWQMDKLKLEALQKSKIYRWLFWAMIPLGMYFLMSLKHFYRDAPRDPLLLRVLVAFATKPVYGLMCGILVTGVVFKIEGFYRGILEWEVWTLVSRLSYCAYLVHFPVIRYYTGTKSVLLHMSTYNFISTFAVTSAISLLVAIPLWLLVESPCSQITDLVLSSPRKRKASAAQEPNQSISNGHFKNK